MQQAADITADDSIDKYYTTLTYDERNSNIVSIDTYIYNYKYILYNT